VTIVDALADRHLFGSLPAFRDLSSWRAWLIFLKACYGLPLAADEVAVFCHHTGRASYSPPHGGWPEVVCITGRQSGKTRIAALVASFEAMTAPAELDDSQLFALLVAQDQRASIRALLSYARAPFTRAPMLRGQLVADRAETIGLKNGATIAAYPCRPQSVRGVRACAAICDELAFFKSNEGFPVDVEMLRAIRPALATTGGKLIVLSSPYAAAGALFDLHRKHFGKDDAPVLVWQATAPEMNPLLPHDYVSRMQLDDPEAYASEVLGQFRTGLSTFLDPDALAACVASGVRERAPEPAISYSSFVDSASGGGVDAFTCAVSHIDGERAVLDVVRAWRPPFNPSGVIAEVSDLLKSYRLTQTTGDRYAPGFVAEQFRANGIDYRYSERDRSTLYLALLPLINSGSGRVQLLDVPELLRELRGLERRRGASGRDRVSHGPGSGQHDDMANAAAGALVLAADACSRMSPEMTMALLRSGDDDVNPLMRGLRQMYPQPDDDEEGGPPSMF
jgi:hypothetical protein